MVAASNRPASHRHGVSQRLRSNAHGIFGTDGKCIGIKYAHQKSTAVPRRQTLSAPVRLAVHSFGDYARGIVAAVDLLMQSWFSYFLFSFLPFLPGRPPIVPTTAFRPR